MQNSSGSTMRAMRQGALALIAVFSTLVSTQATAGFDAKAWKWRAPIDVGTTTGFVSLEVSPTVFDLSQPDLADVRVLDAAGNLVPHMITWSTPPARPRVAERPVQLLNATYQARQFARVTLDFGQPVTKSEVIVSLPGQNFRRKATVEGSADAQAWETVAENLWLFDVSLSDKQFQANRLRFPQNNFRYLRLTVFNMPDDPERITIDQVLAEDVEQSSMPVQRKIDVKPFSEKQDEKYKLTEWQMDLGSRNLPLTECQFTFADPYFHRAFELYGRNSTTESLQQHTEAGTRSETVDTPWQLVQSGVLYRILENTGNRDGLKVTGLHSPYRYQKLVIRNQDDPPLHLTGATFAVADAHLAFSAKSGEKYTLLGGNPAASAPNYDMANAVGRTEMTKLPLVNIGAVTATNDAEQLAPWSERHSTLLMVLLVAAVAGMLALVLGSMRQKPSAR